MVTSLGVQGLLGLTLVVDDALNFMLDLCTSLSLVPYFLAAAYALKLGLTGEAYEDVSARVRRRETIFAGAATAYTLFLFDAAGLEFLLLSTVILAPATLLYVKARSEHGQRIFSPTEIRAVVLIAAGAAIGVYSLRPTGRISKLFVPTHERSPPCPRLPSALYGVHSEVGGCARCWSARPGWPTGG